jgi:hypothetical protein
MITRAATLVGLVVVLTATGLRAQTPVPTLPAAPVPVVPPAAVPPTSPLTYVPPPASVPGPPTTDPGPAGWGLYAQPSAQPGWFASAELALVFPSLKFAPVNEQPLPTGNLLGLVHIPKVGLSTTVSPTFEVGYRLCDSDGLFAINYRFLTTEGTGTGVTLDGAFQTRTRLDSNVINFDYGTATYEFFPHWLLSFRIGAELADVFFDSTGVNPVLFEQASTNFVGGGFHARMDIERQIVAVPGLSVVGRIDGAVLLGQVNQHFRVGDPPNGLPGLTIEQRRTQTVPNLILQAGLSYCPPGIPGLKIVFGYDFERWWYVGQLGQNSQNNLSLPALAVANGVATPVPLTPSRGEFWLQGVFLRAQYDF